MRYLSASDETFSVHGNFIASTNPVPVDYIVDSLAESESFEELTKTNRALWPDEETVGVTSENDMYGVEIRFGEMRIRVDDIEYFDSAYTHMSSEIEQTPIEIPDPSEFQTDMCSLHSTDEQRQLTYDESKCVKSGNPLAQCEVEIRGEKATYTQLHGTIVVTFNSELSDSEMANGVQDILSQDLILVGEKDQINE